MRCPSCGRVAHVEAGPTGEVHAGTVAGVVESTPRLRCSAGHDHPAAADQQLVTEVLGHCRAAIPHGVRRRLRPDACRSCATPLTMPVRRTTRSVTVTGAGDLPVLTLHFDLPMTRCPACGLDQLPVRSQDDLAAAVRGLAGA